MRVRDGPLNMLRDSLYLAMQLAKLALAAGAMYATAYVVMSL